MNGSPFCRKLMNCDDENECEFRIEYIQWIILKILKETVSIAATK